MLSLPHRLRYLPAWDRELCRVVLAVYARALLSFQDARGAADFATGTPGA